MALSSPTVYINVTWTFLNVWELSWPVINAKNAQEHLKERCTWKSKMNCNYRVSFFSHRDLVINYKDKHFVLIFLIKHDSIILLAWEECCSNLFADCLEFSFVMYELGSVKMLPLFEFEPELVLRLEGTFLFFFRCLGPFRNFNK